MKLSKNIRNKLLVFSLLLGIASFFIIYLSANEDKSLSDGIPVILFFVFIILYGGVWDYLDRSTELPTIKLLRIGQGIATIPLASYVLAILMLKGETRIWLYFIPGIIPLIGYLLGDNKTSVYWIEKMDLVRQRRRKRELKFAKEQQQMKSEPVNEQLEEEIKKHI